MKLRRYNWWYDGTENVPHLYERCTLLIKGIFYLPNAVAFVIRGPQEATGFYYKMQSIDLNLPGYMVESLPAHDPNVWAKAFFMDKSDRVVAKLVYEGIVEDRKRLGVKWDYKSYEREWWNGQYSHV